MMNKMKCMIAGFGGHMMKHYLITTVEEFDDGCGGPASRMCQVINRKCMRGGCDHQETEVIQTDHETVNTETKSG